ncbi:hypothetical protein JTB14_033817 [Gonioctena quinquepunctata]|nr:hypothetical protein JTB14_033817 [Gonioctena quinquepunctata]
MVPNNEFNRLKKECYGDMAQYMQYMRRQRIMKKGYAILQQKQICLLQVQSSNKKNHKVIWIIPRTDLANEIDHVLRKKNVAVIKDEKSHKGANIQMYRTNKDAPKNLRT